MLRSDRTYGHKEASVPWEQHRLYDVGSFVSIEADCLWGGVTKPLDARPPHMVVFRLQWQYTYRSSSIHSHQWCPVLCQMSFETLPARAKGAASASLQEPFALSALSGLSHLRSVSPLCPERYAATVERPCIPSHEAKTMLPIDAFTTKRVKKALHDSVETSIRLIDRAPGSDFASNFEFMLNREHVLTGAFERCDDFDTILDKLSKDDSLHEVNRALLADLRSKKTSLNSVPDRFLKQTERLVAQTDQEALSPLIESVINRLSREARTPTLFKMLLQEEHETVRAFAWCEDFPEVVARLYSNDSLVTDWAKELLKDFHKQLSNSGRSGHTWASDEQMV